MNALLCHQNSTVNFTGQNLPGTTGHLDLVLVHVQTNFKYFQPQPRALRIMTILIVASSNI